MNPNRQIGVRVKNARAAAGITQMQLRHEMETRHVKVHGSTIAKIELGDRTLSLHEAAAIAGALGVSTDYLAGRPLASADEPSPNAHIIASLQNTIRLLEEA